MNQLLIPHKEATLDFNKIWQSLEELSLGAKIFAFLFGLLYALILPIGSFLIAVGALVMIDLFTGVAAAKKRKEKLRSKGLRDSVIKTVWYFMAILTTQMMKVVFFPTFPIVYIISAYIAVIEFKSLLENIGELTGTDLWNAVKEFMEKSKAKKP